MKKLLKYANGDEYVVTDKFGISPNIEPVEEYDLEALTDEEIKTFRENVKDKRLRKKMVKIG